MSISTRRQFGVQAGMAAAGALLPEVAGGATRSLAGTGNERALLTKSVVVPHDFVGMHFHRWPQGNPLSPAPTYAYGTVRSHDYGIGWNAIHNAPGQFRWDRMDTWVKTHASAGKTLIYTVYGTPAWASSEPDRKDSYGNPGGSAPPRDPGPLREFVQTLVSRYNSGRRQIQFVEIWNEPHFNGRGFWLGSSHDLVLVGKTVFEAAKAADRGIKVLSPAFDGVPAGHLSFATNGVPAGLRQFFQDNPAETAQRFFDGFAVHTYNADILDPTHGLEGILLQVRETLKRFQADVPVYVTETGFTTGSAFLNAPPEQQGITLRRQAAVQAALGVQSLCFYSHDDAFCGNPSIHPAVAHAIDDISRQIAGRTLRQVSILPTGEVRVQTSATSFVW